MVRLLTLFLFFTAANAQNFPQKPDPLLTPGEICFEPKRIVYPEKVQLCERDVTRETRAKVINTYVSQYGFIYDNVSYKLDHYIPLCMGGSNSEKNLWVQHKTIFSITDKIEFSLCEQMALGRLKQKDAIFIIKRIKNNIDQVEKIKYESQRYLK